MIELSKPEKTVPEHCPLLPTPFRSSTWNRVSIEKKQETNKQKQKTKKNLAIQKAGHFSVIEV